VLGTLASCRSQVQCLCDFLLLPLALTLTPWNGWLSYTTARALLAPKLFRLVVCVNCAALEHCHTCVQGPPPVNLMASQAVGRERGQRQLNQFERKPCVC
jgi:hypothetical protein